MAEIKFTSWKQMTDRMVKATVWIFPDGVTPPADINDNTGQIGHFEFTISGDEVIAAFALPPAERGARMLELVKADPKIQGIIISQRAQALLQDTYEPPFVTTV